MMSEREELARLLHDDEMCCGACEYTGYITCPDCRDVARGYADKVLAAGYRKPKIINTAEELDSLPVDTAIIGTSRIPNKWPGAPYAKAANGEWYDYANEYHVESDDVLLPATVTFEPEDS